MWKALCRAIGVHSPVVMIIGVTALGLSSCGKTANVFEDLSLFEPSQTQRAMEPEAGAAGPDPSKAEPQDVTTDTSEASGFGPDVFESIPLFAFLKEALSVEAEAPEAAADAEGQLEEGQPEYAPLQQAEVDAPAPGAAPVEAPPAVQAPQQSASTLANSEPAGRLTPEQPELVAVVTPERPRPVQPGGAVGERPQLSGSPALPEVEGDDRAGERNAELLQAPNSKQSRPELLAVSLEAPAASPSPNSSRQAPALLDAQQRYDGALFNPELCTTPAENAFWMLVGGELYAVPKEMMAAIRPEPATLFPALLGDAGASAAATTSNSLGPSTGCPENAPQATQLWLREGSLGEMSLVGVRIQTAPQPDHAESLRRDVARLQSHPSCEVSGGIRGCLSQERSSQGVKQLYYITQQPTGPDSGGPPVFIRCEDPGSSACEIYHPLTPATRLVAFVSFNGEYLPPEGGDLALLVAELQRVEVQVMSWRR